MPIEVHHVVAIVNEFGRDVQIQKTIHNSLKAAAITGLATLVGGLLAGRRGVVFGAAGGGLLGMSMTDQDFVGLPAAFNRLPAHVKNRIASHFQIVIDGLEAADASLVIEVAGALANGGTLERLGNIEPLRNVFQNSVDFIREQIREEQLTNPNLLA